MSGDIILAGSSATSVTGVSVIGGAAVVALLGFASVAAVVVLRRRAAAEDIAEAEVTSLEDTGTDEQIAA
jgi:hypothetical protein